MKTKTRNTIGKILVWGGLAILVFQVYSLWTIDKAGFIDTLLYAEMGAISLVALLIGGIWGMKR